MLTEYLPGLADRKHAGGGRCGGAYSRQRTRRRWLPVGERAGAPRDAHAEEIDPQGAQDIATARRERDPRTSFELRQSCEVRVPRAGRGRSSRARARRRTWTARSRDGQGTRESRHRHRVGSEISERIASRVLVQVERMRVRELENDGSCEVKIAQVPESRSRVWNNTRYIAFTCKVVSPRACSRRERERGRGRKQSASS